MAFSGEIDRSITGSEFAGPRLSTSALPELARSDFAYERSYAVGAHVSGSAGGEAHANDQRTKHRAGAGLVNVRQAAPLPVSSDEHAARSRELREHHLGVLAGGDPSGFGRSST